MKDFLNAVGSILTIVLFIATLMSLAGMVAFGATLGVNMANQVIAR